MRQNKGRVLTGLVTMLLLAGLFLAYDASRHPHSRYDVAITQYVQAWDVPGLSLTLEIINELTNFYPGVAIWSTTFVFLFLRGLRVEALTLLLTVMTFVGSEAFGLLVGRPRPSPELVHVSQSLVGFSFPSGHVLGAVVFYGVLSSFIWHRTRWLPLRSLFPVMAASIVGMAALARVYLGVHWASDVLGGLLLGGVALAGLLWVYTRLRSGYLEFLGLQFRVTEHRKLEEPLATTGGDKPSRGNPQRHRREP